MEEHCTLAEKVDLLLSCLKSEIVRLVEAEVSAVRDDIDTLMEKSLQLPVSGGTEQSPKQTGLCDHAGEGQKFEGHMSSDSDFEAPHRPSLSLRPDPSHGTLMKTGSQGLDPTASSYPLMKSLSKRSSKTVSMKAIKNRKHQSSQERSCVLTPENNLLMVWHFVNIILISLCVWADMLSIVDTFPGGYGPFGYWWEVSMLCIFGTDMLINFNVAVEIDHGYCKSRRVIAKTYLRSWFCVDLLTLIPWSFLTQSFSGKAGRVARLAKSLKILKTCRFAKAVKLATTSGALGWLSDVWDNLWTFVLGTEEGAHSVLTLTRIVSGTVQLLVLLFLESFIVVCFLLARHDQPDHRWSHDGTDAADLSIWQRYTVATFWSFNCLAMGSLDVHYLSFRGSMSSALLMQFMVAALHAVNILFALHIFHKIQGAGEIDFNVKVRLMKFFLRKQHVTEGRRKKVLSYLRAAHSVATQKQLYKVIEDELSPHLGSALACDIYSECITSFHAFLNFPFTEETTYSDLIKYICRIIVTEVFPDRHVVISASQSPACMYFLRSGEVEVLESESKGVSQVSSILRTRKNDDQIYFFAVKCIFSPAGARWSAEGDVISTECSEFGKITRNDFDNMIYAADFPEIWLSFINFLRFKVGEGSLAASEFEHGLDEATCEEWKQIHEHKLLAQASGTHNELGISCAYLVQRFKRDLRQELGECDLLEVTFNDLGQLFWLDAHKGFRGSADFICPRDLCRGSSIVDALDEHEKGKATVFVSWCWRYTVDTLVSSLARWAAVRKIKASSCFLWVCFFCNNQRKLLVDKEPGNLAETFGPKLMAIGSMVMIFDTYQKPLYTSRLWCIYEAFTARKVGIELEVAMPGSCQDEFQNQLVDGGLVDIQQSLTKISVEHAEASVPADREQILELVAKSIGFEAMNEGVKCALMSWLTVAFQDCLRKSTISEPARIVMSVIKTGQSDHDECSLMELMVALERHPGLLDLFDFNPDMSSEDMFASLEPGSSGASQQLSIKSLDSHLKRCHKHTMVALAKWLSHWSNLDPALRKFCDEVVGRVQAKAQTLKDQLQESESALHDLRETNSKFGKIEL